MAFVHRKLCMLLLSGAGDPTRQPFEGLMHHFTGGGSMASHAAHHGLHTAAMTAAAAASSAAMASSAAVAAAAVSGAAALTVAQGRAWGIRAAAAATLVATAAWFSIASAAADTATLILSSMPRTLRAARWAVHAALSYKRFAALHAGADPDSDAYLDALGSLHTLMAGQLLDVCRANGGVYIKAGQFAACFGAVPREYRLVLATLEDRATPQPFPAIRAVVDRELAPHGGHALFAEFEEAATAAASLAQVHKARLNDGGWVAVKVQYPGLGARVAADLAVLRLFNVLAATAFPSYRLGWMVDELAAKLGEELDFRTEVSHAARVGALLEGNRQATVPRMHAPLCTPRLLVMEWVDGLKVTDRDAIRKAGISPKAVGIRLVRLFGQLTMVHGFMHGDPHAGNLMVRPKGRRSWWRWLLRGSRRDFELVLLDHGTYLELGQDMRHLFCQLWCSFVLQDSLLQSDLCSAVAGERGPVVLPVLLTQSARSRAEERAVRKAAGIASVGDMAALLQAAPREVVEILRINTVIRAISAQLGVSMDERKRILACYARKGLPARGTPSPHMHARFNDLLCRVYLTMLLGAWHSSCTVKEVAVRAWSMVLGLWADVLFD